MTNELNEIWKCQVCGNIVELVHVGGGPLVCCGEAMHLQVPNTVDAVLEKHVPVIEKNETGYLVKIGSIPHPMEEAHHIEWIELMVDDVVVDRAYLKVGAAPEWQFNLKVEEGKRVWAREYCNIHNLWIKE